jgi:hypothetical protein
LAASAAIRRNDHRNAVVDAIAGLGAAIAIGATEWFSLEGHYPLVINPFALLLATFAHVWHRWIGRWPSPQRWL